MQSLLLIKYPVIIQGELLNEAKNNFGFHLRFYMNLEIFSVIK
jgi:hypothetical protein